MEIFGVIAGILVVFAYAPQAIKTIRTRQTRDLSLSTYLMIVVASACWVMYGVYKHSIALWLANSVVGILALIIVIIRFKNDWSIDVKPHRNLKR